VGRGHVRGAEDPRHARPQRSLVRAAAALREIRARRGRSRRRPRSGSFETLATALRAAGLVGTLQGKGPYTVIAPTDEAFAKLPAGTAESLLKPENKARLQAVLTYHVIDSVILPK
jgi:uncharacterized surface protein with fasciclin (FAS1) repeats